MVATVALLLAAVVRLPFAFVHEIQKAAWLSYAFLLPLLIYDLWSTHRVQRVTIAAGAFFIAIEQLVIAVGPTLKSQALARWMYDILR